MTPPTIPFHPRTSRDPPHHSAPLIGELSAQLTEGLSHLKNPMPPKAFPRGPRCSALPVAEEAEHKRVQRSVGNAAASAARRPQGTANG